MTSTWTIEFPAGSISAAVDIVRQHAAIGTPEPDVTQGGRMGFEYRSSDYDLIDRVATDLRGRGQSVIVERAR